MAVQISEDEAAERAGVLFGIIAETLGNQPVEVIAHVLIGLVSAMALGHTRDREGALEVARGFNTDVVAAIEGHYAPPPVEAETDLETPARLN